MAAGPGELTRKCGAQQLRNLGRSLCALSVRRLCGVYEPVAKLCCGFAACTSIRVPWFRQSSLFTSYMQNWSQVAAHDCNAEWRRLKTQVQDAAGLSTAKAFDTAVDCLGKHQAVSAARAATQASLLPLRAVDVSNDAEAISQAELAAGVERHRQNCSHETHNCAESRSLMLRSSKNTRSMPPVEHVRDTAHIAYSQEDYKEAFAVWRAMMHQELCFLKGVEGLDMVALLRERSGMLRQVCAHALCVLFLRHCAENTLLGVPAVPVSPTSRHSKKKAMATSVAQLQEQLCATTTVCSVQIRRDQLDREQFSSVPWTPGGEA